MSLIENILLKLGPCLSSDLTKVLIDTYQLSPDAARKRVSRGCKGMNKLEGLPFPRNAKFIYLKLKDWTPINSAGWCYARLSIYRFIRVKL